jgi:tetratricopeptide (TPR) repeat protein
MLIKKIHPKSLKTDFSFTIKDEPIEVIVDHRDLILKLTDEGKLNYELSQCYKLIDEKQYDEALECLNTYFLLINDNLEILIKYCNVLIMQRKFDLAKKILLDALNKELSKELPEKNLIQIKALRYHLGRIYDYEGKRDKAIEQYKASSEIWCPK